jgi:hypothetical protein
MGQRNSCLHCLTNVVHSGVTFAYSYDKESNRTQTIYPDGKIATATFDAARKGGSVPCR